MTRLSARGNGVRIKCQISSNTNVAVDRVLTQLIRQAKEGDQEAKEYGQGCKSWCFRKGRQDFSIQHVLYTLLKIKSINEFERALKKDGDPRLKDLMRQPQEKVTSSKTKITPTEADVIGVTCASAGSTLLTGIQSRTS